MITATRSISAVLAGAIIFCACGSPIAEAKRPSRAELAQKAVLAVQSVQQAEKQLDEQVLTVERWLAEFNDRYGHYPQSAQEIEFFQTKMGDLLPPNPFVVSKPISREQLPLADQCVNLLDLKPSHEPRIKVIFDPSLNESKLRLATNNHPDSWSTTPGDITIVTNGSDLCVVIAGGCDGRPQVDQNTGKIFYNVLR